MQHKNLDRPHLEITTAFKNLKEFDEAQTISQSSDIYH